MRSTPDQTRSDRPILKPKATTVTTEDALRPLPTLGRRPTPEATNTPKHKASPLRLQSRRGNKRTSITALLASIDQEVEAGAGSLAPTAGARRRELLPPPLRRCRIKFGAMGIDATPPRDIFANSSVSGPLAAPRNAVGRNATSRMAPRNRRFLFYRDL